MPSNRTFFVYIPIFIAAFFAFGLYLGTKLSVYQSNPSNTAFSIPISKANKLNDIINYVDNEYVDEVKKEELVDKAIQYVLQELDPHSYYISSDELAAVTEPLEGSFEGIGVQFSIQKDTVVVISPVLGGPSEKVGIQSGDRIVKVNDELIAGIGITNKKVMTLLKGEKGTSVKVTIYRNSNFTKEFTINRDKIPIYSLDVAYMITNDIGYLKLSRFSKTTYDEFISAGNVLKEIGMQKMILDLRGNGGGYLDAATAIADEFLPSGSLIVYTEGRSRPRQDFISTSKNAFLDIDLVVLIDEGSASASEIIAGAIQDNDRGNIIGRRSFGKGLVQEQSNWPDGSATRLTIARYYTPTGRCIQKTYESGHSSAYYDDFENRKDSGEIYDESKISFPDSLKFTTPKGKTVYGGGGIMPDYFVPLDTSGSSWYLSELFYSGMFYEFAFDYSDKNRAFFKPFKSYKEFEKYFDENPSIYHSFIEFAKNKGITGSKADYIKSETNINLRLKAQIARNLYNDNAFYPIVNKADKTVIKALEVLNESPNTAFN